MKKILLFILMITFFHFSYSLTIEEFRNLNTYNQMGYVLETYGQDINFSRKLAFSRYVLVMMEDAENLKTYILEILETNNLYQDVKYNVTFRIAESILLNEFVPANLLTNEDKSDISNIYLQKSKKYLEDYKIIDRIYVFAFSLYEFFKTGKWIENQNQYAAQLYQKLLEEGWTDITLNYY